MILEGNGKDLKCMINLGLTVLSWIVGIIAAVFLIPGLFLLGVYEWFGDVRADRQRDQG